MCRRRKYEFFISIWLCLIITVLIYYFDSLKKNNNFNNVNMKNFDIERYIQDQVKYLEPKFFVANPKSKKLRLKLIRNYKYQNYQRETVWLVTHKWKNYEYGAFNPNDPSIGKVLKALRYEPIRNATNALKGTQLKLNLFLNSQNVLFKPQWYRRDEVIDGPVYGGKDRHNAEIYAFYLAAVLNMSWIPLVVGRRINLKEIYEKGDIYLRNSMFYRETKNITKYCLYGNCFYCKKKDYICGNDNNTIEGAVILIIPGTFKTERSPWQRTYKNNFKAKWEENIEFCKILRKDVSERNLLNYVDVAIFDFLIQNGDRHHFETIDGNIILFDNGKSFANPHKTFFDILAPLYQCCIIKKTTWNNLKIVSGGALTNLVDEILKNDELSNILTSDHKKAIEKRLTIVYAAVQYCINKYGKSSVFI